MVVRLEHQFFGKRLAAATLFSLLALSLLILRLYYLQGIYGSYFRDLSENNRTRTVRTTPPRGTMYDRNMRLLVGNRPAFDVGVIPEDVPDLPGTLAKIASVTGRSIDELSSQLALQHGRHRFEPKLIMADVPRAELAKIKAHTYELPGVIVDVVPTRYYPFAELAAQLFGYTREITKEQLDAQDEDVYRRGDIVGQSGIEKTWEKFLRGQAGYRQVEVDARGNRTGELGLVQDLPGKDLVLSIDLELQQAAQEGLKGKRGAAVVLDPNTGEVLALASSPSFDANIFSGNVKIADWQKVTTDKALPLTNRPIASTYPIGSTFKLVTTTAVLAEKKMTPESSLNCPGYYMFAGRPWRCHKHSGHGTLHLRRALAVSCNAFYFQVGQMLGIGLIEKYAKLLGMGRATGIDLPGEVSGIVPSEEWKLKKFGYRWYPGDTLPVSIGQGYIIATPIQMATMVSTIANGGTVYKPLLVKKVIDRLENKTEEFAPTVIRETKIDPKVLEVVRDIAAGVVNDQGATGKAAKFEEIRVGGKTGTAQVTGLGKEHLAEGLMDHAWFLGFAPVEKPMIALGIIVENGGHGGTSAAPISHQIMEAFFRKKGMLKAEVPIEPVPQADISEGVGDEGAEEAADQTRSAPAPTVAPTPAPTTAPSTDRAAADARAEERRVPQ